MSIQFKSILELKSMLNSKTISTSQLIEESFKLTKALKDLKWKPKLTIKDLVKDMVNSELTNLKK